MAVVTEDQLPMTSDWEDEVRQHRKVWDSKPMLRRVYHRWFDALKNNVVEGKTLEVGGGSGNLKSYWPTIVSCDVVATPWLDFQADCTNLPLDDESFDNVVGVDVLHHLYDPDAGLREIGRVLRSGGRAVFIEPYASLFARIVRGRAHHEQQDLERDAIYGSDKKPEEANLAIPTRLFVLNRHELPTRFPQFDLRDVRFSDPFAYPLTGGFSRPLLLPDSILRIVHAVEPVISFLDRWFGFKMLIVLEKRP